MIIAIYVDDILFLCNVMTEGEEIENKINEEFKIKNLGPVSHCLGIEVRRKK